MSAPELAALEARRDELAEAKGAVRVATEAFHAAVVTARDAGHDSRVIAKSAGVSVQRVTQLAPVKKAAPPRVHAQEKACADSRVTLPSMADAGVDTASTGLSGVVTQRLRRPLGSATLFYRDGFGRTPEGRSVWLGWLDADNLVGNVLAMVGREFPDVARLRVFLTGARPYVAGDGSTLAEAVRGWALNTDRMPEGWEAGEHYLSDSDLPVLRFARPEYGQRVTIMRAASWWGETDADPQVCAEAWYGLEHALGTIPAFEGAGLADTPATAGRALWRRTIPDGKGYAVMSDEYRELIASTAGQGRIELRPAASRKVEGFTVMDGRFMYASLCHNMPVGEPTPWTHAMLDQQDGRTWQQLLRGRGRWHVTCTVPAGWDHVGLFMAPDGAGGWHYPSTPGETFTTWADGSELWLAMEAGWEPEIREGFTWAEGKPLEAWSRHLLDVWKGAMAHRDNVAAGLAARAVRSMLLFALGAFATRAHPVTRQVDQADAGLVPDGAEVRRVGDRLVWQESRPLPSWAAEQSHPEWSATVWARARTRLLSSRSGVGNSLVGALRLPAEQVVGFHTDALYLTTDPGWPDDGAPGRFRVKGRIESSVPWPTTLADLYVLNHRAGA